MASRRRWSTCAWRCRRCTWRCSRPRRGRIPCSKRWCRCSRCSRRCSRCSCSSSFNQCSSRQHRHQQCSSLQQRRRHHQRRRRHQQGTSAAAASPHQCNFHSQQASANLQRVDMSGGRQVPDVWQLDSEFSSMQATLFADDHRGEYELQNRLRSDFLAGRVRVVCARTRSGATRFWHTQCTHCLQFNHVEYGSWACQTPEDKARARQQLFLWHCPPIEGAPRIAPGAALPAGRPQV